MLDSQNTYEKKIPIHEIPKRKNFGPTKYPQEKISDPQKARWHERHDGTRPTRLMMTRDPLNLAHSLQNIVYMLVLLREGLSKGYLNWVSG